MKRSRELKGDAQRLEDRGDYRRSRELFEAALILDQQELGEDNPLLIDDIYNLALTCVALEDNIAARRYLERALRMQKSSLGSRHEDVIETEKLLAGLKDATRRDQKKSVAKTSKIFCDAS